MTKTLVFRILILGCILVQLACNKQSNDPSITIEWKLVKNIPLEDGSATHHATFKLESDQPQFFTGKNWALYWNQAPRRPVGINNDVKVTMTHINGDFYSMVPANDYENTRGNTLLVEYTGEWSVIKESDAPLGVYLTYIDKSGEEKIIKPSSYSIGAFSSEEQLTRSVADKEKMATPENLFIRNAELPEINEADFLELIPAPKSSSKLSGASHFGNNLSLSTIDELQKEFQYFKEALSDQLAIKIDQSTDGNIVLALDPQLQNDEAYQLIIENDKAVISGGGAAGVFYGIQSLLALLHQSKIADNQRTIPNILINDEPAFGYRGMHIDVGRNFQTKDQILKMLDLMSMYKLNKFLFYLTEDEGWRLAIEEFPELTQVSARRGHTLDEQEHLQPSYGSGPDPNDPKSFGNGHYSREDFKEILQYAHARHIDVIPEVNFPGHARTAIMAMENRYRRLMAEGKQEEAERYRLIDPDDESIYESAQGYKDNIVCVCKEAPYAFYEVVLDDIIEMYREADVPLTMMHSGGDEVPKGAWSKSPLCQRLLIEQDAVDNSRNLQGYFFGRLVEIIQARGLPTGAWEEAIMEFNDDGSWDTRTQFVNKKVYPYVWQNLWGNQDLGYKMANLGYPVILCNVTNFYFDLAYDKDPREPGLYWAGFNNSKHAFDFIPYDLFKSTTEDDMGHAFDVDLDFKDKERLSSNGLLKIAGLQSQLWSETIKGGKMLEHYTLPKMIGFAERAWRGQEEWMSIEDKTDRETANMQAWSRFIRSAVAKDFNRLDTHHNGYMYRIPAPGILVEDGGVRLNTAYPGMQIRYTTDGTSPTMDSPLYEGGLLNLEGSTIKAKCFNQMGRSGLESESALKQFEL